MANLTQRMREIARSKPVTILVCEGWDERCLKASAKLVRDGICNIKLLGNPEKINAEAKKCSVDLTNIEIVDHNDRTLREELASTLFEARKHKGMDLATARKLLDDVNYFGCAYALAGHVDGVAGSAICPTGDLMKPALQLLRGKGMCSEVAVVTDPRSDRTFFVSDASMNIDPTPEHLATIAGNAVVAAQRFGVEPKVAFLSFGTKGSGGEVPQTLAVREATRLFQQAHPHVVSDGELQLDAAVNSSAAARKCPNSPLKGQASVLIFPNLTASNIFVHGMMQFSSLTFEFTLIEGMAKPVSIIGRSTTTEVVENMIASAAMQANS